MGLAAPRLPPAWNDAMCKAESRPLKVGGAASLLACADEYKVGSLGCEVGKAGGVDYADSCLYDTCTGRSRP